MKIGKIVEYCENLAPVSLAEEWDNVGLMCGSLDDNVTKIICCMDFTREILEIAKEFGAELVITHHPLIFSAQKSITDQTLTGALVLDAIKAGINVYSMHTNLDYAEMGINYSMLRALGFDEINLDESGKHRYAEAEEPIVFSELLSSAKEIFDSPNAHCILPYVDGESEKIRRIGVSSGAFDGEYAWLTENNIDVLITGEMKHHNALELKALGIFGICLGHFESENPGVVNLSEMLAEAFPDVEIIASDACRVFD